MQFDSSRADVLTLTAIFMSAPQDDAAQTSPVPFSFFFLFPGARLLSQL
jgi:hypothetical protein